MKRRTFLLSTLGTGLFAAPALSRTATPDPEEADPLAPRMVRIKNVEPAEIHVVPREFALYWTLPNKKGRAIRYRVSIGRDGLYEPGVFTVGAKKEWPSWRPTDDMIERQPHLYKQYEDGMPGGPNNPLGARAIYLFTNAGGDSMLRIHGTQDLASIGRRASNGCVRMANSHVVHLYEQVPLGARVVLHDV
ncbi:L,D-transpeptidase [Rhodovulum euryhalinum]|uniref:Lipoprotein-anchoring transpeptidase ErfK/SrfK n=1 Tax=Rhodovulum euryhalinum TaxID=35805 RepID=A0A4R2KFF6_9RHOB|nr:L,D-transpeptidase [Rhodovulum euryhalinum]TCO72411.1 lipoprotein-anchoring transpeptidase ErfK/SrfK [Rhodovulum euryhalinum]